MKRQPRPLETESRTKDQLCDSRNRLPAIGQRVVLALLLTAIPNRSMQHREGQLRPHPVSNSLRACSW